MVYYLVYGSSAAAAFSEAELDALLAQAMENNERDGLTGILLHADRAFLQVLEGEKSQVEATFAKICKDPRHSGIELLFSGETRRRQFPEWTMACRKLAQKDFPKGVVDLRPETLKALENVEDVVRVMAAQFYNAAYRFDVA